MPNPRLRLFTLAAVVALAAACGEAPTAAAPGADEADLATRDVSTAVAGLDRSPAGHPASPLHRLVQHALHRVVRERGQAAAESLAAPIIALHEEARRAHVAGDAATARQKAQAAEQAMARVVVGVLGPQVVRHVMQAAEQGMRAVHQRIRHVSAAGGDPAPLQRLAAHAGAMLSRGKAAASAGNPAEALLWSARALGVVEHATRDLHDGGALQALLRQALAHIATTQGPAAARDAAATVDAARRAVEEAHGSGDREALRAAVHQFEHHVATLIVGALGPAPVGAVLTQAARQIEQVGKHIDRAAAHGRDTAPMAERLQAAQQLLRQAHAARDAGDAVSALVYGARSLNVLAPRPGR